MRRGRGGGVFSRHDVRRAGGRGSRIAILDVVQLSGRRVVGCRSSGSQGADDEGPLGTLVADDGSSPG
jgi:hypothetical protein